MLQEIDSTDPEMMPPPYKLESSDKSIGYITDDYLRKVFSLASFYRRESKRMQVDLEAVGMEPLNDDKFTELKQKYETLIEIFWLLLRYHTNYWSTGIGIRKDWEIVSIKEKDSNNEIPPGIKKLFGLD
ncbi:hypothetical protein J2P12_00095 [Candidatus Bathyarchaeota archaeon]|nr:hypothetical protein [Candidatus Bathyarchaeota archaeon]